MGKISKKHGHVMELEIIQHRNVLGEAPVWDPRSQMLTWVDCDQKRMFQLDPSSGQTQVFALPHHPGSYAFCAGSDDLLLAYRNKLAVVNLRSGDHRVIKTPLIDFSTTRFNDGACDRKGRFWVGTMDKRSRDPIGALYRVDPDLSIRQMAKGVVVSNGIAFSPDDSVMYHTDSRSAIIYAYDYDIDEGTITNGRIFADFRERAGRPDGCTTDRDGCLWVAVAGASSIVVLDPFGKDVNSIALPVSRPTSLCFGGPEFETLYVTSMRLSLSEVELAEEPYAGSVFAIAVEARGMPEPFFGC